MSRSARKSPFTGVTAAVSDKSFKKHSSRALRKKQKRALSEPDPDRVVLPAKGFEAVDRYASPKEGKKRVDPSHPQARKLLKK